MNEIKIKQIKSSSGRLPKHILTLKALGLRKVGDTRTLPATDAVKGMVYSVCHLVSVECS